MIGWYIHHVGHGHRTRAESIRPYVGTDVVYLSSLDASPGTDWVRLARDDTGTEFHQATAHDLLHWAPLGHVGFTARMSAISSWISANRPDVLVVDVSVEVALLARLHGVPVIVLAGPGHRCDAPHQWGYGIAERIIAPWPQEIYDPAFLHPFGDKTHYVGAISRFDGRDPADPAPGSTGAPASVVVLTGAGGNRLTEADVAQAQAAVPALRWRNLAVNTSGWTEDVWPALSGAAVVVSHGGQNAVAEVAAARRPAVIIAQDRPFDEQHQLATALAAHGIALSRPVWPAADEWPALIEQAIVLGGENWSRWSGGDGASQAGRVINQLIGIG